MYNTTILCTLLSFVGISLSTLRAFLRGTGSRAWGYRNVAVFIPNGFTSHPARSFRKVHRRSGPGTRLRVGFQFS